jgi:hypothetical protein
MTKIPPVIASTRSTESWIISAGRESGWNMSATGRIVPPSVAAPCAAGIIARHKAADHSPLPHPPIGLQKFTTFRVAYQFSDGDVFLRAIKDFRGWPMWR